MADHKDFVIFPLCVKSGSEYFIEMASLLLEIGEIFFFIALNKLSFVEGKFILDVMSEDLFETKLVDVVDSYLALFLCEKVVGSYVFDFTLDLKLCCVFSNVEKRGLEF